MRRAAFVMLLAACAHRAPVVAPNVVTPVAVTAAPPVVVTQDEASESDEEEYITPCAEDSPEHKAASDALAKVSHDIDALPLTGDAAPLGERLTNLVDTPCFVGASSMGELALGTFASALSLKSYWRDGGHAALNSRLEWARKDPKDHYYWNGPSIRTALTTENAPKTHPLYPLLCSGANVAASAWNKPPVGTCASETNGWELRASAALHAYAQAERAAFIEARANDDKPTLPKTPGTCAKEALAASADRAFGVYSECMQHARVKEDALPLGNFRAPTSGWLVLRGRRGHYNWCNELRAYDLATGSAYIASFCAGMMASPNAPPSIKVERGKVPLDALREAAWMMFLSGVADRNVIVSGEGRAIPPELAIRIPKNKGWSIGIGGFGWSSGRTTLVYQWIRQGKSAATGTTTWPDADKPADQHATTLLAVAEAGFVKTCTGVAALPAIPWSARTDKATRVGDPEGYFPDWVGPEFDDLERELAHQAHGPCTP